MLRQLGSLLAVALIGVASFQAPTAHLHSHGGEDHHGGFAHSHWSQAHHHQVDAHHDDGDGEWELIDEDETAISVEWTPEPTQRVEMAYAEVPVGLVWELGFVPVGSVTEYVPNSHSPPARRLRPARAPPV